MPKHPVTVYFPFSNPNNEERIITVAHTKEQQWCLYVKLPAIRFMLPMQITVLCTAVSFMLPIQITVSCPAQSFFLLLQITVCVMSSHKLQYTPPPQITMSYPALSLCLTTPPPPPSNNCVTSSPKLQSTLPTPDNYVMSSLKLQSTPLPHPITVSHPALSFSLTPPPPPPHPR